MMQCKPKCAGCQGPIVFAPVIFHPGRMFGISVQIFWADTVMLALDHAAKPGEKAFSLVCATIVNAVAFFVIDPARIVLRV